MVGMLSPEFKEQIVGTAEIRETFGCLNLELLQDTTLPMVELTETIR